MSAELVILVNLSFYFFGFSFLLYQRNQLSEQSVGFLSILINFIGLLFSMGIRLSDISGEVIVYPWFCVGNKCFMITILLNNLTYLMYFLVQFIALWVQVFSLKYMEGDPSFGRYFAYLNLFVFAMIGIIVSGNLFMIFIFWELVGFCSYLLIGFWYEKKIATNAAIKAFLVNRIGDVGFLIGILLVYRYFDTLDLSAIIEKNQMMSAASLNSPVLTTIGLLLFCACVAKSAQLPLQVWLPDAMEGPTPVSALIHAATMVAAGIFLMARLFPILSPDVRLVMSIIGMFTMFFGACSALIESDIKKLLAFSTISQLGLMVVGIGIGAVHAALFHLITHAFFKAGLFLSAGAIIQHLHHEQDMRKMSNLRREVPVIFYTHIFCAASLAGIPFFSGFLSKDALLVAAFQWASQQPRQVYFVIPILCLLVSGMSAYYMMRQVFLIFFQRQENPFLLISASVGHLYEKAVRLMNGIVKIEADEERRLAEMRHSSEKSFFEVLSKVNRMEWASIVMAFASFGFVFATNPFSVESSWFFHIFPHESETYHWIAYVAILVAFTGAFLGYFFTKKEMYQINNMFETKKDASKPVFQNGYVNGIYEAIFIKPLFWASCQLLYFDRNLNQLYQNIFIKPLFWISPKIHFFDKKIINQAVDLMAYFTLVCASVSHWFERNIINRLVNFTAQIISKIGSYTRKIQNGRIQTYIITMFVCLLILLYFIAFLVQ